MTPERQQDIGPHVLFFGCLAFYIAGVVTVLVTL